MTRHQGAAQAIDKVADDHEATAGNKKVCLSQGPVPTTWARYGALIDAVDPLVGGARCSLWAALNSGTQSGWPGRTHLLRADTVRAYFWTDVAP